MPEATPVSRGFVYVATGPRYRQEAAEAAARLRKVHPAERICLVTEAAEGPAFWDDLAILDKPAFGFRDKIAMRLCPYGKFVYLDTDAAVVGGLTDIFDLLDRFDFAGHQLFEGHDRPVPGIPDAFPEFQGGVLAFRASEATSSFFGRWLELYDRHYAQNGDGHYDYANVGDQRTLRMALYESRLRLAVLGPEYDFTPAHVTFACAPVRVIHGRGPVDEFAARLNRRLGNRAYLPRLDAVLADQPEFSELRRLWVAATLQLALRLGRKLTPLAFRNWLRRSSRIRSAFLRNRFSPEPNAADDRKWRRSSGE